MQKGLIAFLFVLSANISAFACPTPATTCGNIAANQASLANLGGILFAAQYPNIQTAVNSLPATGGTIIIPTGTTVIPSSGFRINTTKPNVHLVGQGWGSVIQRGSGLAASFNVIELDGAGSSVENLTVDGNSVVHTGFEIAMGGNNSLVNNVQVINDHGAGMIVLSGDGARVTQSNLVGLSLNSSTAYGVNALFHKQVFIDHNTISGTGIDCIGFDSNPDGRKSVVTDNVVTGCHNYLSQQGGAIAYYDVGGSASKGAVISNNVVVGGGFFSNGIEIDAEGAVVTGNDVSGCGVFGIIIFGLGSNTLIEDNRVKNCAQHINVSGIVVTSNVVGHVTIKGNLVQQDDGVSLMTNAIAISQGPTDNYSIEGNDLIPGSGFDPIYDGGTGLNKTITNNIGVDNVIPTVASASVLILPLNPVVKVTGSTTVTSLASPVATFTGAINSATLTVSGVTGTIAIGQTIYGVGVPANEVITGGSGTTWTISPPLVTPSVIPAQAMSSSNGFAKCWNGRTISVQSDSATPFTATGNIANAVTLTANGLNQLQCDGTNWHLK